MNKLIVLIFTIVSVSLSAQNHEHHNETPQHVEHGKHKIAFYTGFTHVESAFYEHETHAQSTGKWVPTLGLDYFYKLNEKWSIGSIIDMEFDNYMVKLSDHSEEERLNVLISSVVAKYNINHHLGIFVGPGIETEFSESAKNFFVAKFGFEYEIEITDGWEIAPSLMYDWKQEYKSFAYGFSIGKRF